MSTTTVSGSSVPAQFTGASGAPAAFSSYFNSSTPFTVFDGSGVSTITGSLVIGTPNGSETVSASAVVDTSSGGNNITLEQKSVVFAGPNDTINAAGAVTLFGGGSGTTHFSIGGADSSIVGGTGGIMGEASGANDTLVGGSYQSVFTVTGANSLAVAGPSGITGIDESASTGPETIATNPLGNSGTLIATLGSGADTVVGGSGASTITGGSGDDVFAFVKGHAGGSETILNFTSSDTFALGGYGYSLATPPAEKVIDGNDVITLSDNTTITLIDIGHKIF